MTPSEIKAFAAQIVRILGPKLGCDGPRIMIEDAIRFYSVPDFWNDLTRLKHRDVEAATQGRRQARTITRQN